MTTGNVTEDSRRSLPNTQGLYGRSGNRTWNGADNAKITRPKRAKKYTLVTFEVLVWRFGKQIKQVHTYKNRVYTPNDPPPKRARLNREDHAYTTTYNSRFDGKMQLRDGRLFTNAGAGYFIDGHAAPWSANAEIALLGKLREKVAGSGFNAGVMLGESSRAISMIGETATKLAKAYLLTKKGKVRQAAKVLTGQDPGRVKGFKPSTATSSNWLQLQYGWLPLLADAKNGAEFLSHHFNVPLTTTVVVQQTTKFGSFTSSSASNAKPTEVRYLTRRRIKASLTEKNITALAGLTDPLSVAWELVPYSFVVDWFIPIGNWLSARALSNAITGKFVVSTKTECKVIGMTLNQANHIGHCPEYRRTIGSFTRVISNSLSVPTPEFKTFSQVLSLKRALNGIALLHQAFSRK